MGLLATGATITTKIGRRAWRQFPARQARTRSTSGACSLAEVIDWLEKISCSWKKLLNPGKTKVGPGAVSQSQHELTGTINQVDWAEQIKTQVHAEFDRVAKALELAASKRAGQDRADIQLMIAILEDKRAEVMANDRAGYFIHDWQELRGQVRELITKDPRYGMIKASKPGGAITMNSAGR